MPKHMCTVEKDSEDLFLLDPTLKITFTGVTQCNQILLVTLSNIFPLNDVITLKKCFCYLTKIFYSAYRLLTMNGIIKVVHAHLYLQILHYILAYMAYYYNIHTL